MSCFCWLSASAAIFTVGMDTLTSQGGIFTAVHGSTFTAVLEITDRSIELYKKKVENQGFSLHKGKHCVLILPFLYQYSFDYNGQP